MRTLPLPSGAISLRTADALWVVLTAVGCAAALALSTTLAAIAVAVAALSVAYSLRMKDSSPTSD